MNKNAIVKRLEELAEIFKEETPFYKDLKAMANVLDNIDEDVFKRIIVEEFSEDEEDIDFEDIYEEEEEEEVEAARKKLKEDDEEEEDEVEAAKKKIRKEEEEAVKGTWTVEAAQQVQNHIVRDILGMDLQRCCDTGRKLEEEQIPDGTHKNLPKKPDTLIDKQTPNISKVIKSDMVKKSKETPIRKEAKALTKKEKEKEAKRCKKAFGDTVMWEGIEIDSTGMGDVELSTEEASKLASLF